VLPSYYINPSFPVKPGAASCGDELKLRGG